MKNILTILSASFLFHFLFWNAQQGLNILLFTGLLSGGIFVTKRYLFERKEIKMMLMLWNISAFLFVLHASLLSLIVYWGVFFIIIGFLQKNSIRFWIFIAFESIGAFFAGWAMHIQNSRWNLSKSMDGLLLKLKKLKLAAIPLLIIIPFYFIYTQANADFAAISHHFWANFFTVFEVEFNPNKIGHLLFGTLLAFAVLGQRNGNSILQEMAKNWHFDLKRSRKQHFSIHKILALRYEYQIAVMSFISLNVLLAFMNGIDIISVWFSFEEKGAAELSQYVHQGTYLLIFSILLAMGVVLGFLRKNLNFYTKNKMLLQLIYLWLAQNAFLAISVAIRNGHYIHRYGLAHGRIQVIFFLGLVLFGLFSLFQKVRDRKTVFYLVQKNGWAFIIAIVMVSAVNWDAAITRYNLTYQAGDSRYLTHELKNNLIPLIQEIQNKDSTSSTIALGEIRHKGEKQAQRWESTNWRGWTWSGYRQYMAWKTIE